jgi:hypothetical protein
MKHADFSPIDGFLCDKEQATSLCKVRRKASKRVWAPASLRAVLARQRLAEVVAEEEVRIRRGRRSSEPSVKLSGFLHSMTGSTEQQDACMLESHPR